MNSILRKSLGFILVLFLMVFSFSNVVKVRATDPEITTYTFTSKSWTSEEGNWTSNKDGAALQSGRGIQVTTGATGANATSPTSFTNISRIVVTYSTNASAGAGNVTLKIGTNADYSQNVTKTGGTTDRTLTYDYSPNQTGVVKITVNCTTNSIYIKSIAITADAPQIGISLTDVNLKVGQTGQTSVTFTPADTQNKNVTYQIANEAIATVEADGTITALFAGSTTMTVTPEADGFDAETCIITVSDYPAPALTVGSSYILYANHANGNYQLSGVADNLGTGVSFDEFPDEDVFPLEVENGIYVNTIALKNGDNYLSLSLDDNKLQLSDTKNANSSWLVSLNNDVYTAYNVAYQTRKIQFNYNKGNVRYACYSSDQTAISFREIGSTSVTITSAGNATKAYIGDTLNFNVVTNVQNPVVTWNSSNTSAATIDSNGVLHPAGIGRTNITATINDVESDSIEITILPNPESPITVAQANAIGDLTGETATSEIYAIDGTITYVDENNLTLTDNSGSFAIFKFGHGYTGEDDGKEVRVTGKIIKYENTTNQMRNSVTITLYRTVTFDSNGGSAVASQKVLDGAKATRPTPDPTKDGFTFNTWKNADNIYDFNSTVTADLTLTAEWVGSTGTQILNLLNSTQTYMSLAYKYSVSSSFVSDTLNRELTGRASGDGYGDWEDKTVTTSAVYKGNTAGGNNSIQLRNSNNSGIVTTTSGGHARIVTITFDGNTPDGRTIDIYGSNTAYSEAGDLYNEVLKGTKLGSIVKGTSTILVISGDYQYIGIRANNGAVWCTSIEVTWGAYDDCDFRLRCGFDNSSFATDLAAISGDATYGIEVSTSPENKRSYASTNEYVKTSGDMKYVLIDLGDALTNADRLDMDFTVKVYVELDEVRYYATNDAMTKTYSVASMVNTYYANDEVKPLILNLYNLLVSLGKINN